jgi:ComF family protein
MNGRPYPGPLSNRLFAVFGGALSRILADLLPQTCFLCGAASGAGLLCAHCSADLPTLPAGVCPVCALPTNTAQICGPCQRHPRAFDRTVAGFLYDFPIDELVQALKYGHRLQVAGFFADTLAARLAGGGTPPDLVLPMPLHPVRLARRGYNQAAEIARPLARRLGCRLALTSLVRDIDTPPQVGLPWKARAANVRGAFRCVTDLGGLRVAVVDDVLTTGATLHEVARCLKGRGAAWVENWVVARTP